MPRRARRQASPRRRARGRASRASRRRRVNGAQRALDRVAELVVLGRRQARERRRASDGESRAACSHQRVEASARRSRGRRRRRATSAKPASSSSSSIRAGSREGERRRASPGRAAARGPRSTQLRRRAPTPRVVLRRVPDRERDAAAGPQHAARLAQRGLGVGEQHVAPAAEDAVDASPSRRSIHSASIGRNSTLSSAELLARARARTSTIASAPSVMISRAAGRDQLGGEQAGVAAARRRARAPSGPAAGRRASTSQRETRRAARLQRLALALPARRRRASQRSRLSARWSFGSIAGASHASSRRSSLPERVRGSGSATNANALGTLKRGQPAARSGARSSLGATAAPVAQARRSPTTASPHSASARPCDGGLGHGRVGLEHRLDLGRRDVLAAGDDRVGLAPGDAQAAVARRARRDRRCAATGSGARGATVGPRDEDLAVGAASRDAACRTAAGRAVVTCEQASVRP